MAFGMQTTVNDRMKNNASATSPGGYIAGPNHALLGASAAPPAPGGGDQAAAAGAPNYRECEDASQCCKMCEHHEPQAGMCTKYNFKDSPMMVCDSFEPIGGMDQGQDQAEGESGMDDAGMMGAGSTLG